MTIVVTGGGSGGHITPLLAVASELKQLVPDARIVYVGQKGDRFAAIMADSPLIDKTHYIRAGKLRRYHNEGWRQILDVKTMLLNLRDLIYLMIGCLQSLWLLGRLRPSVLFVKGGYVGVPLGLAAAMRRVPYVTHDSDALAGLANRLIARWARVHAVALPKAVYPYPAAKTVTTGVPIGAVFKPVDATARQQYRQLLGLEAAEQVVLITGGGLGSQVINEAAIAMAPALLSRYPKLHILHISGHQNYTAVAAAYKAALSSDQFKRLTLKDYIAADHDHYSGAADVVVTRAGATYMAELAMQAKACIVVPNPALTGGHQVKNALVYAEAEAAILVEQAAMTADSAVLGRAVERLLDDSTQRDTLGRNLHQFAYIDAAKQLAELLLATVKSSKE